MNIQRYLICIPPYKNHIKPFIYHVINIYEQHINLLHNFIIIRYVCIKYLYITNIYGNNRVLQINQCLEWLIYRDQFNTLRLSYQIY